MSNARQVNPFSITETGGPFVLHRTASGKELPAQTGETTPPVPAKLPTDEPTLPPQTPGSPTPTEVDKKESSSASDAPSEPNAKPSAPPKVSNTEPGPVTTSTIESGAEELDRLLAPSVPSPTLPTPPKGK